MKKRLYIHRTLGVLGVMAIISSIGTVPAIAASQEQILAQLRQSDNALREGALEYTHSAYVRIPKNMKMPPGNPSGPRSKIHIPLLKDVSYTETAKLYYATDGRYRWERDGAPPAAQELIYNGTDYLQVFHQPDSVTFCPSSAFGEAYGFSSLVPGPCFALGRGLSSLDGLSISQDSNGVHLSGTVGKSVSITAKLDPVHGYVASQITRFTLQGRQISVWTFCAPKQFTGSPYIATNANYEAGFSATGDHPVQDHYIIKKASFTRQDASLFTYNWHNGMQIEDNRLKVRAWGFKPNEVPKDCSSQQLLAMTKAKIAEQKRISHITDYELAFGRGVVRVRPILNIILYSLIMVVIILTGWFWRKAVVRKRAG